MVVMERPGWALGHIVPLKVGLVEDEQLAPLWGETPVDQSKTSSPLLSRPGTFCVYDLRLKLSGELAAFLCADNQSGSESGRTAVVCVSVCAPPAEGAKDG